MSSLGDLIGDVGSAFGDKGQTNVVSRTKNPALQQRIDLGLADYDTVRSGGESALKDYITKYFANEAASKTRTGEEIGNLDRYFNGGVANDLSGMRNRAYTDALSAGDLGSRFLLRNYKSSVAGQDGMPSSTYFARAVMPSLYDIQTHAALARDAAERGDWGMLENARLGLTGQRNALANAQAGYGLVPENVRRQMYGQNLGYLGQIGQLDQANKFYGLEYSPSASEMAGKIVGDVGNTAMQLYSGGLMGGDMGGSGLGSMFGGGGGGTKTGNTVPGYWGSGYSPAPTGTTTNWGSPSGPMSVAPGYNPYAYAGGSMPYGMAGSSYNLGMYGWGTPPQW